MRTMFNIVVLALLVVLAVGAWECTAAPRSQCEDGAYRTRTHNHKVVRETCSNGEWVDAPAKRTR